MSISKDKIKRSTDKKSFDLMLSDNPDRVPVTVGFSAIDKDAKILKLLVPRSMILGQLQCIVRQKRQVCINRFESIYFFIGTTTLASVTKSLDSLHEKYKNEDGILVLDCTKENTFGFV